MDHFDALHSRALVQCQCARYAEALEAFAGALKVRADRADVHSNMGNALLALERPAEALACFDHAVSLDNAFAEAHFNRGNALDRLRRPEEALAAYDAALRCKPDFVEAWVNRAIALGHLERYSEALAACDEALARRPGYFRALNNKASALNGLRRCDEALQVLNGVFALKPGYAEALVNRGTALLGTGRHKEAAADFERAAELKPGFAEAHYNAGYTQLLLGDYRRGWRECEWRFQNGKSPWREFAQPLWLGESALQGGNPLQGESALDGKTILLHAEQGLGDTLQFCRYVPLVAARASRVILEVQAPLRRLAASLPGAATVISMGEPFPPHDVQCPLMSLPLAFGTELHSVPAQVPYLRPEPAKLTLWRERLGPRTRPRVGLVCSGNPRFQNDQFRSMPMATLPPLLEQPCDFVLVQKEVRDEDFLATHPQLRDIRAQLDDFSDTAALVACLDLMISVDTSAAHLAGALGRPLWVVLPHNPDFRWLLEREDSPWYPTARLFRQRHPGDWAGVVARVAAALAEWRHR